MTLAACIPWKTVPVGVYDDGHASVEIHNAKGESIIGPVREETALVVVSAVNAHGPLLSELGEAVMKLERLSDQLGEVTAPSQAVEAKRMANRMRHLAKEHDVLDAMIEERAP